MAFELYDCVHKIRGETREGKPRKVDGWTGWIISLTDSAAQVRWNFGDSSQEELSNLAPWRHSDPAPKILDRFVEF